MSTRPMVTVGHPGFDETAVVPVTALPRMAAQGWYEVDETSPAKPADDSVKAILAAVGDDPEKAADALATETAGKNRTTLIAKLQALIDPVD